MTAYRNRLNAGHYSPNPKTAKTAAKELAAQDNDTAPDDQDDAKQQTGSKKSKDQQQK